MIFIQNKFKRREWSTEGTSESLIGQLLTYLLGAQLLRIKATRRSQQNATPVLGLYMENLQVIIVQI